MSVPRSRILDLLKVQCRIFSTTYNPLRLRTGNRILRERLKGPAIASYYPRRVVTMRDLHKAYAPELETWDEEEEDRLEGIVLKKQRGKGAPKKKKTAEESKKFKSGKRKPAPAAT